VLFGLYNYSLRKASVDNSLTRNIELIDTLSKLMF